MKKYTFYIFLVCMIATFVGIWFFARDTLPGKIKIATAMPRGMYYKLGRNIEEQIEKKLSYKSGNKKDRVVSIPTKGTLKNIELLLKSTCVYNKFFEFLGVCIKEEYGAHIAILEFVQPFPNEISVIAPLYYEPALILAKKELAIDSVFDLHGRPVCIWPKGSGAEKSTELLLDFYGQEIEEVAIDCFAERSSWDAVIAVFGLFTPSLQNMVQTGDYKIIGLPATKALAATSAFVTEFTIPEGIFARKPHLLPAQDIQTIAYTALLAVNNTKASSVLINETLDAVYHSDLTVKFPMLMSQEKAKNWSKIPLHPIAQEYFEPYRNIGVIANFMESLAAVKELLFAFAAACYFLWLRLSELHKKEERELVEQMKEQLDDFLKITMAADRKQMQSESREELVDLMRQITDIKLQALEELTDEKLRSDQMFSIFLMQCHNVISKIQAKLAMLK